MVMPIQIYVPNRDGGIGVVGFASKSGGIRVFRRWKCSLASSSKVSCGNASLRLAPCKNIKT